MAKELLTVSEADVKALTNLIKERTTLVGREAMGQEAVDARKSLRNLAAGKNCIRATHNINCYYPRGWRFRQGCHWHCDHSGRRSPLGSLQIATFLLVPKLYLGTQLWPKLRLGKLIVHSAFWLT